MLLTSYARHMGADQEAPPSYGVAVLALDNGQQSGLDAPSVVCGGASERSDPRSWRLSPVPQSLQDGWHGVPRHDDHGELDGCAVSCRELKRFA